MFTGIIEERGVVLGVGRNRLAVGCRTVAKDSPVGASIAVSGVCLTVVANARDWLGFDVSRETLARTSLAQLAEGDPVNLERPVTLMSRLGGHLVQGHVDGVGEVTSISRHGAGATVSIRPPAELLRSIVEKGSVGVDGVSLTVAGVADGEFSVALIPHTLAVTTLGGAEVGDRVNLEADVIAKYVANRVDGLMEGRR